METRANYVLIGAFTLAAVVGAFLFVMWIAGYGSGRRSPQLPGRLQGLGLRALKRRQRPVQRDQGWRGHPSHLLQERSASGRRRHRRQLGRADRQEHQGAARDAGAHRGCGGRPPRRREAADRNWLAKMASRRLSTPNSRYRSRTFSTTSARSPSGPPRFWTTPTRSSPTIPSRSIRRSQMSISSPRPWPITRPALMRR